MDALLERIREPRFGMTFLTAIVSLLMAGHWIPMMAPGAIVLVLALLRPSLVVRPAVWWVMASLWLAAEILVRDRMEDHVYLFTAWLFALALSLALTSDEAFVERSAWHARVLIGVTFTAAVGWKLYFGDYVSGNALWVFIVIDERFGPLAQAVGLSDSSSDRIHTGLEGLLDGSRATLVLDASDSVVWRIAAAAILALLIEAVIALAHLAPDTSRLSALRLPSVVIFSIVTYAVVPVLGFAALLAVLTIAVAGWRPAVMWVFPVLVLVSCSRLLLLA